MADLGRVALVHDYLNQYGGAERVVEVLLDMFPGAPLYTSLYDPSRMPTSLQGLEPQTTFLQRLPFCHRAPRCLLPLYPRAFARLDLTGFDLLLSSSSAFAKCISPPPAAVHVCYCHTPMRFVWCYHDYVARERLGPAVRVVLPLMIRRLRAWDLATAATVHEFIANSQFVAERIQRAYGRSSAVIYPPVECDRFEVADGVEDYFLIVSRLRPYKRVDLAVRAFNELGLPLKIVGSGADEGRLRAMAGGTVELVGRVSEAELRHLLSHCRALIFPGVEDFGLAPVEAQASGRPVIAFAGGGALETVKEGETGLFFREPTAESLAQAVRGFDAAQFDSRAIRRHAMQFDVGRFRTQLLDLLQEALERHKPA